MTIKDNLTTQAAMTEIKKLHTNNNIPNSIYTKISTKMDIGVMTLLNYANHRIVGKPQRPTALMLLACIEDEIPNLEK
jgi:hypothetical protein